MTTRSGRRKAVGADLTGSGPVTRLVRRRRSPAHPWAWQSVCSFCGPIGDGFVKSEQAATEAGFEHARRHREPKQLELELFVVDGSTPVKRRRRKVDG